MRTWDIYTADVGYGPHPAVIVSHPDRAARKEFVEIVRCSSQRSTRAALPHEVILDENDGLDWATLCFCDLIWAVPRAELLTPRGHVGIERRRAIVATIIRCHGWTGV